MFTSRSHPLFGSVFQVAIQPKYPQTSAQAVDYFKTSNRATAEKAHELQEFVASKLSEATGEKKVWTMSGSSMMVGGSLCAVSSPDTVEFVCKNEHDPSVKAWIQEFTQQDSNNPDQLNCRYALNEPGISVTGDNYRLEKLSAEARAKQLR